jgi:6-pyruvoyltetrahydropterin/6-carboxytetrahydropterin synthase
MSLNIQCSRKIHFCSGHRVLNHETKCANLHGHNYVAWFNAEADSLDSIGRIIDFSVLKEKIGGWIDKHWDHTTIIFQDDTDLISIKDKLEKNKPVWISPFNPTAENMAKYLFEVVCPDVLKDTGVFVTEVILYETENCYAKVSC